jgi:hypothetical protein
MCERVDSERAESDFAKRDMAPLLIDDVSIIQGGRCS